MKNNELLINEVTLARYGGVVDSSAQMEGNKYTHFHVVDFTTDRTITCVIDVVDNVAIDIETGEVWNLLKRNENYRIIDELIPGQIYPVVLRDKNWSRISQLYQLSLKARAKKIYQRYLESKHEEHNNQKIKNMEN